MPSLFFPPKPNRVVIGLTHLMGAFLARRFYQLTLKTSQQDIKRLKSLSDQRVIYLVNHPSFNDPIPVMLLSAKLRKGFYYLGSVEQFSGLLGLYLQRIGAYSVRRGQRDRPSIQQSLVLLSQPNTHLVFFPEGGCSFQNDTVMPFRPGAIQIAFQAMQRAVKQGHPLPPCYIVPLALKYQYIDAMEPVIDQLLEALEHQLKLVSDPEKSRSNRLRAIATRVMLNIAQDYGFEASEPDSPLMIESLRSRILESCELALGIEPNLQARRRERTYEVEATLNTTSLDPIGMSRALIRRSVFRLFNFDAIYNGYVAEQPTAERMLDTLTRLEREVFEIDRPQVKGRRVAQIAVGDIFNLKDDFDTYQESRASTIDQLTLKAQTSIQTKIDAIAAEADYLNF